MAAASPAWPKCYVGRRMQANENLCHHEGKQFLTSHEKDWTRGWLDLTKRPHWSRLLGLLGITALNDERGRRPTWAILNLHPLPSSSLPWNGYPAANGPTDGLRFCGAIPEPTNPPPDQSRHRPSFVCPSVWASCCRVAGGRLTNLPKVTCLWSSMPGSSPGSVMHLR